MEYIITNKAIYNIKPVGMQLIQFYPILLVQYKLKDIFQLKKLKQLQ